MFALPRRRVPLASWLILLVSWCSVAVANEAAMLPFRLPSADGKTVDVPVGPPVTAVCFLGTECPLARLYGPRLAKLAGDFTNVRFLAINSNQQDSTSEWRDYGEAHGLSFPLLKDHGNQIADRFGAERTPEVFLLDQSGRVRYRGRIDDQYTPGVARNAPTRGDLREAIVELLAGKDVSIPRTPCTGCKIGRVRTPVAESDITYCAQVARILRKHCVECHREGEIGPFRLDDYEEVIGWADTILEVIEDGRMPPWHANPQHGKFQNARHMKDEEKAALQTWVDAGMPFGDPAKLPDAMPKVEGWNLERQPDLVLTMNREEFRVPPEGTVDYQYFVVDPGFKEDRWITGAQVIPGNARVVHHSIVFVRPPDGAEFRGLGWLSAYVPGARVNSFPPGHAIKVPANSKFVFQQHYTPVGTEQDDLTQLGITFGKDEEITHEIYTLVGIDQEFEIPPHAANHVIHAKVPFLPPSATLLAATPHMHVRGKAFRLFADRNGVGEIILDVPQYDFNWQHTYRFTKPIPLTEIDSLEFDVTFDNSANNPTNPNPDEYVTWGDQTWEEMAVAFFEVSAPRDAPASSRPRRQEPSKPVSTTRDKQERMKREADRILAAFDKNRDGQVHREETPQAFRRTVFGEIDRNGDDFLTRQEIEKAAGSRVQ